MENLRGKKGIVLMITETCGGIIMGVLYSFFTSYLDEYLALMLSTALTIFCMVVIRLAVESITMLPYIRKRALPFGKYEGIWIQKATCGGNVSYSISYIEFNRDDGRFYYRGEAYKGRREKTTWESNELHKTSSGFSFEGDVEVVSENNSKINLKNYGKLDFNSRLVANGKFNCGSGFVIDIKNGDKESLGISKLEIYKITSDEIKLILGKREIQTQDDICSLIEKIEKEDGVNKLG